jgi:hypothetical protein
MPGLLVLSRVKVPGTPRTTLSRRTWPNVSISPEPTTLTPAGTV